MGTQHADMTDDFAQRIERVELDDYLSRLRAFHEQPCNPRGIEFRRFGQAMGLMARGEPLNSAFNRIMLFGTRDIGLLDEIFQWYQDSGIRWRIDLVPHLCRRELLAALAERGWYQCQFQHCLYGLPPFPAVSVASGMHVDMIDATQMSQWAAVYQEGFGVPEEARSGGAEYLSLQFSDTCWRLYGAWQESRLVAVGTLYLGDQGASLGGGTTLPMYRGRGCQTALVERRLADAAAAGCGIVTSQAGGSSLRNMERCGMRLAYTKVMWEPLESPI